MIYIVSDGPDDDYRVITLLEGPADANVESIGKELKIIDGYRTQEWRAKKRLFEERYHPSGLRKDWPAEVAAAYPEMPTSHDALGEWLSSHPDFRIVEYDEISIW